MASYKEIVSDIVSEFFKAESERIQEMIDTTEEDYVLVENVYELLVKTDGCGSLCGSRTCNRREAWETLVENADKVCEIEDELGGFYTGGRKIERFSDYYEHAETIDVIVCEELARNMIADLVESGNFSFFLESCKEVF